MPRVFWVLSFYVRWHLCVPLGSILVTLLLTFDNPLSYGAEGGGWELTQVV